MAMRWWNDILRPTHLNNTTAIVITPMPPTWIKQRMIPCPKAVKYVPVSTTINPVTHTAEVAVKRASIHLIEPPLVENGRLNKLLPTRMASKKLAITRVAGLNF
jgi:hypothetical protein